MLLARAMKDFMMAHEGFCRCMAVVNGDGVDRAEIARLMMPTKSRAVNANEHYLSERWVMR